MLVSHVPLYKAKLVISGKHCAFSAQEFEVELEITNIV